MSDFSFNYKEQPQVLCMFSANEPAECIVQLSVHLSHARREKLELKRELNGSGSGAALLHVCSEPGCRPSDWRG